MTTTQDGDETPLQVEFTLPDAHARALTDLNDALVSTAGVPQAQLQRVEPPEGGV